MEVFTEEWVNKIRNCYERRPGLKPYLYLVATKDEYQATRAEIEIWVSNLPQNIQPKVISNLQSSRNHIHTYNELAVGSALKQLGYQLEYEKALNCLIPDWYVYPKGTIAAFIVEVFTAKPSENRIAQQHQKKDLFKRLEQIPIDVSLNIRFRGSVVLDPKKNKILATEIRRWLEDEDQLVGTKLFKKGIIFEIFRRGVGFPHVTVGASLDMFWVNSKSLREKINDKIRKYKNLLQKVRIPFVIAIIPDSRTGLDLDNFGDVLIGQEIVELILNNNKIIGHKNRRNSTGLFCKKPSLSAAIWAWRSQGKWKIKSAHNPNAAHPLPRNTFGGFEKQV
jgi:hypothetical protein